MSVDNIFGKKEQRLVIAQFASAGSAAMLVTQSDLDDLNLEHQGETVEVASVTLSNGDVKTFKTPQRVPVVS